MGIADNVYARHAAVSIYTRHEYIYILIILTKCDSKLLPQTDISSREEDRGKKMKPQKKKTNPVK